MTEQRRMPLPDGWSWAKSAAIHPHASFEAVHKHGGFVHILTGARAQFAGSEHATLAVLVDRIGPKLNAFERDDLPNHIDPGPWDRVILLDPDTPARALRLGSARALAGPAAQSIGGRAAKAAEAAC